MDAQTPGTDDGKVTTDRACKFCRSPLHHPDRRRNFCDDSCRDSHYIKHYGYSYSSRTGNHLSPTTPVAEPADPPWSMPEVIVFCAQMADLRRESSGVELAGALTQHNLDALLRAVRAHLDAATRAGKGRGE